MKTYHGAKDGWLEDAVKARTFRPAVRSEGSRARMRLSLLGRIRADDGREHRFRPERRRRGRPADRALNSELMALNPASTSSPSAAPRSTSMARRSAGASRTWRRFSKAVGGCPTNIAIGTARLGLKSGLITRVGDEHMGRFIREQCAREGVDVTGIHTDPARLTSLVLLGIRDEKTFPLIFYRDNCADSALDESDIDPDYIESAEGDPGQRHAFRARQHRRGAAESDAHRPRRRAARSCSTSITGRTSGVSPATARAKSVTSSRATSRRASAPSCRSAISSSAPRRR